MDKEGSEVTDNTPLQEYFQVAFASKPAEKLDSWLKILLDEEYETVGSLRHASDEEWQEIQKLSLPLAIVGQLKRTLRVSPSEIKLPDGTKCTLNLNRDLQHPSCLNFMSNTCCTSKPTKRSSQRSG